MHLADEDRAKRDDGARRKPQDHRKLERQPQFGRSLPVPSKLHASPLCPLAGHRQTSLSARDSQTIYAVAGKVPGTAPERDRGVSILAPSSGSTPMTWRRRAAVGRSATRAADARAARIAAGKRTRPPLG